MRSAGFLILIVFLASACQQKQHPSQQMAEKNAASTGIFGNTIVAENAVPVSQISSIFNGQDSLHAKVSGHISASCKHSGCWMDLDIGNGEYVHVTFLNEAFTIPLDAAGKNAVAEGIAYREMIPVETLRNYARDEGKSEEEIAAITEPGWTYDFVASGVIIEE